MENNQKKALLLLEASKLDTMFVKGEKIEDTSMVVNLACKGKHPALAVSDVLLRKARDIKALEVSEVEKEMAKLNMLSIKKPDEYSQKVSEVLNDIKDEKSENISSPEKDIVNDYLKSRVANPENVTKSLDVFSKNLEETILNRNLFKSAMNSKSR
ncbi:MAG: hypothetical protein BWY78_01031 [Alphaproteobacteria bacterium ADurb.Bin438]|nr:MAG: hypothetical protein BWY78_01031 [Alphaproteobacteria bacterium ADurb.Bin438]